MISVLASEKILFSSTFYLWISIVYSLEYKYTKLAESKSDQTEYLPSAETCGIEDDDEDEVSFLFLRNIKMFSEVQLLSQNTK